MPAIVIDPGHGGTAPVDGSSANNATGPMGLLEKNVTLEIGRRIKARAGGVEIVLTRDKDENLGLRQRAEVARKLKAPVFVSVHLNGWHTPDVQGTETFVHSDGSAASLRLARAVHARVLAVTGLADRKVKQARFGVIDPAFHDAGTAACLVEISFLTDPKEEARLKTPAYLDQLADAVLAGVKGYLAAAPASVLKHADDEAQEVRQLPMAPGDEDAAGTNLRAPY